MRAATFARLVHELAGEAVAAGADPTELLKAALAGTMGAIDPTDRISALDVKIRMRVSPGELEVSLDASDRASHRASRIDALSK